MSRTVKQLPAMTITTTQTAPGVIWEVDEIINLSLQVTSVTSAPGVYVQGSVTTSAGSSFGNLLSPNGLSSLQAAIIVSSSGMYTLTAIGVKQIQLATTAAPASNITVVGAGQYET